VDTLAGVAAALFTVTNPVGNTALFAALSEGKSDAERRAIARTCALAIAVILVVSVWLGDAILAVFGVSTPALETAGGLVIAILGLSMLHIQPSGMATSSAEQDEAKGKESIAIVPLAMPIVAGPGAISTVIVAAHKNPAFQADIEISAICILIAVLIGICFSLVGPITRHLGVTGIGIVTRFMGLVLTAIAIDMLTTGIKGLLPGLG
jgi:multiple antibiotic resistance protein